MEKTSLPSASYSIARSFLESFSRQGLSFSLKKNNIVRTPPCKVGPMTSRRQSSGLSSLSISNHFKQVKNLDEHHLDAKQHDDDAEDVEIQPRKSFVVFIHHFLLFGCMSRWLTRTVQNLLR